MKKKFKFLTTLFALLTCVIFFSSCSGGASENLGGVPTPEPAPTPAPAPAPTPTPSPSTGAPFDGIATVDTFYVGVNSAINTIAHVHTDQGFSDRCVVSSTTVTSQDKVCYIEMPEADIYYQDLALKYNVPSSMCRYLKITPYWFYNEEIGNGPSTINVKTYKTVVTSSGDTTTTYDTNHDCTVDGVLDTNCDDQPEIETDVSDEDGSVSIRCVYDKSDSAHKHNCCFGEYTYTETVETNLNGVSSTNTTNAAVTAWGGIAADCIGGAGKTDWTTFDADGFPIPVVEYVNAGLTSTYTVKSPYDTTSISGIARNIHYANYFSTSGTSHLHSGYVASATTATTPYFIDPIDDRNGTTVIGSSPAYSFECLDAGFESKHRIRVFVRDWDSYTDYSDYLTTEGVSGTPDQGTATGCTNDSGPCNDVYDLDDFLNINLNLASYNTVSPTVRAQNFPFLIYR